MNTNRNSFLVVDDDVRFAQSVTRLVSRHGEVTTVYSVRDATSARPSSGQWTAAFLDFDLMDGDAFAVLDSFKARGEHVPAVIITADPRDEVADHALAMGVTVLHKPIDANDVKRFLDGVGVGPGGMAAA